LVRGVLAVRNSRVDNGLYLFCIPKSFYSLKQEMHWSSQWRWNTAGSGSKVTPLLNTTPLASVTRSLILFHVQRVFVHENLEQSEIFAVFSMM